MTEIFRDNCSSFDKWAPSGGGGTIVAARNGNGFQLSSSTAYITTYFPGPYESDTLVFGFAWRYIDTTNTIRDLCRIQSDNGNTEHNRLQWTRSNNTMSFTRSSTSLGSASFTFTQNTWYYIEVKVLLHASAGTVTVRVNGTNVINLTAQNTKNAGTKTTYDSLSLRQGAVSANGNQYDDFYLKTGSAEAFLGDIGSAVLTPTTARNARHSLRVVTSPYEPGIAVSRHSLRVAVGPALGMVKTYTGSIFNDTPAKIWNGSAFIDAPAVKTWNGTAFV